MKIRVIGQDPSMNNWGLVVADVCIESLTIDIIDMHVIQNLKKDINQNKQVRRSTLDFERARDIHNNVKAYINIYKPKLHMVEIPHGSQSASAMKGYGMCIGILGSMLEPVIELTEQECKIAFLGKRKATKHESITRARSLHPDANWKLRNLNGKRVSVDGYNEHIADAVSAIHAGIVSTQFTQMMGAARALIA